MNLTNMTHFDTEWIDQFNAYIEHDTHVMLGRKMHELATQVADLTGIPFAFVMARPVDTGIDVNIGSNVYGMDNDDFAQIMADLMFAPDLTARLAVQGLKMNMHNVLDRAQALIDHDGRAH